MLYNFLLESLFMHETISRYCVLCKQSFVEEFMPYGITNRPDACCLNLSCRSLERHRLLWLYLMNETNLLNQCLTVLEVGPNKSLRRAFKQIPDINYLAIDNSSAQADVKADACFLPLDNECVDLAICYHVLEHLDKPLAAVKEIRRVLRVKGQAFFQVPIDINRSTSWEEPTFSDEKREKIFGQKDHLRIFGQDFDQLIAAEGFNVRKINYCVNFSDNVRQQLGLKDHYNIGPIDNPYSTCEDIYHAFGI